MSSSVATTVHHEHHHPAAAEVHHHATHQHQFDSAEQQYEASTLGMWIFLVTEIMFFGGVFMAYVEYRSAFSEGFGHASHHLDVDPRHLQYRRADRQQLDHGVGRACRADSASAADWSHTCC